jgi:hypothetical protein
MKVAAAAYEPSTQRTNPAIQMPPGDRSIILRWRKIPEGAKPLDSLFAAIAGDQGCRNRSGGGASDPMQRRRSSEERLIGAGMVSGQSEAAGKNHGDCSGRFFHRSSGSPAAMFDGRPGQGSMMQTLRPVFSFRQSPPGKQGAFQGEIIERRGARPILRTGRQSCGNCNLRHVAHRHIINGRVIDPCLCGA